MLLNSASLGALAFPGWLVGGALGAAFGRHIPWRAICVLTPLAAAFVVQVIGRLCRKAARDELRRIVQTAVAQNSTEALGEVELRIAQVERKWGVLDLWTEKDAIELAKAQLRVKGDYRY